MDTAAGTTSISMLPPPNSGYPVQPSALASQHPMQQISQSQHFMPENPMPPVGTTYTGGKGPSQQDILSALQEASKHGDTKQPTRDIPLDMTARIDPNVQYTHIPTPAPTQLLPSAMPPPQLPSHELPQQTFYQPQPQPPQKHVHFDNTATSHLRKQRTPDFWDIYQVPILLASLYFMFQLPFVKTNVIHYFPFLALSSGDLNVYGIGLLSVVYGAVFWCASKWML